MRAHVVLAHPEPASFNGRLAGITREALGAAGWRTSFSDLCAMDFDPREGPQRSRPRRSPHGFDAQTEQRAASEAGTLPDDVRGEIDRLLACDLLVVHFPLWWFGMPAILKGWLDRVFVHGTMHRSRRRFDTGVCAGKAMIACVTTGASAETCACDGYEGDVQLHLWPLLFAFRYVGFEVLAPEVLHGVTGGPAAAGTRLRDGHAARWRAALDGLATRPRVPYNRDGDFDATGRLRAEAPSYSPFIRHRPERG